MNNRQIAFGRLLPGFHLGVLNSFSDISDNEGREYDLEKLLVSETILYLRIFKDVVEKNFFHIIGFKELTLSETKLIPPHFDQDLVNLEDCKIYYDDGTSIDVTPEECIGLEGPIIWDADGVIERLNCFIQGKKNPMVELYKVILSKDDPRYLPPPGALRWDFEKEEFFSN
ncbi:MAG: hypothetical protein NVV59_09050 [Chitinophagaceae bacterium]|nr:hypothetical protein [Chitinophagaceae bacterium]